MPVVTASPLAFKITLRADSSSKSSAILVFITNREVPYPTTCVIGADGKVLVVLIQDGFHDRHSPSELIEASGKLVE